MATNLNRYAHRRPNLLQRIINRLGYRFGIMPFAVAWSSRLPGVGSTRRGVFDTIYNKKLWGSAESPSGKGSELERTSAYRAALVSFLRRYQIQSIFDAPCGDLNWMAEVLAEVPISYVGADISDAALALAGERRPDLEFRQFDICLDAFPKADIWQCRDTLFHLSFNEIWAALENAARSEVRFALLTTHRARVLRNVDVETGGWRFIDLERAPFNLPPPVEYLDDSYPGEFPRAVGVWAMEGIRTALEARRSSTDS